MNVKILLNTLLVPGAASFFVIIMLFALRGITFKLLHRWALKSQTRLDRLIIGLTRVPSIYWCLAIGLYIGIEISDLPRRYMFYVDRTIYIILIFSITLVVANLSVKIFENYVQRSNITIPATGIVFGVFKGTIIITGVLIIFNILGISITPLITALGVGGLAVALALKDTLSNLFAGLHMIASKEIRPGDYVKLDSGEEGFIKDITWRSTFITSQENVIIVPNAKVANATITNYAILDREVTFVVPIIAPYTEDLGRIERITLEVAKEITENIPLSVPGYDPVLRFSAFGPIGIPFTVSLKAKGWSAHYLVKHEFIRALHIRYMQEGISIPVKTIE